MSLERVFKESSILLLIVVLDDPEALPDLSDVVDDLFLDQVEAHGQERYPEEEVDRAEGDADVDVLAFLDVLGRHEVPEPDGGQSDEAEVGRVEELPSLPAGEEKGAAEDVAEIEF